MAATRTLGRTRLDKHLVERCERHDILNCGQLLRCSVPELVQRLDVWPVDARQMLVDVAEQIVSAPVSSLQISQQDNTEALPTGIAAVDRCLRGGVASRSITEVVGPAGVGKTQFAMMMACRALIHHALRDLGVGAGGDTSKRPPGVIYIDTEGAFSAQRAMEITFALSSRAEERWISRIHVYRISTTKDLMQLLAGLEFAVIQHNIKLIVLDSVAALVRKEFGRDTLSERQQLLARQAAMLKHLAEAFTLPVIVTNQVTTSFVNGNIDVSTGDEGTRSGRIEEQSELTAALGVSWAHFVNTRLALQYETSNSDDADDCGQDIAIDETLAIRDHSIRRSLTVAKSPVSPPVCKPSSQTIALPREQLNCHHICRHDGQRCRQLFI